MNALDLLVQMLLLMPVSLVSAAAVSSFVPRGGAAELADSHMPPDLSHEHEKLGNAIKDQSFYSERIVQSQWEKQRRWVLVYKEQFRRLYWARVAKMTLVSLGAVTQVAATQVPTQYKATTSLVGGIFVGVGAYIKSNYITKDEVADMATSFFVSQAIKAEVCKFRAKVEAYRGNPAEAVDKLRKRCGELSKLGNQDRLFLTMQKDSKPVPKAMEKKFDYVENRMKPTINNTFIRRARESEMRGALCSRIEDVLMGVVGLTGIASTQNFPAAAQKLFDGLIGWTGALTTVSTALANHHAKMKYDEIADNYYHVATQLQDLLDEWPQDVVDSSHPDWNAYILKCEEAILKTLADVARARSGKKDDIFVLPKSASKKKNMLKAKVWDPNVVCGTDETGEYVARDRLKVLMENESLSKEEAQKKIMAQFPDNF